MLLSKICAVVISVCLHTFPKKAPFCPFLCTLSDGIFMFLVARIFYYLIPRKEDHRLYQLKYFSGWCFLDALRKFQSVE